MYGASIHITITLWPWSLLGASKGIFVYGVPKHWLLLKPNELVQYKTSVNWREVSFIYFEVRWSLILTSRTNFVLGLDTVSRNEVLNAWHVQQFSVKHKYKKETYDIHFSVTNLLMKEQQLGEIKASVKYENIVIVLLIPCLINGTSFWPWLHSAVYSTRYHDY